jgi:hypothetical protein
MYPATRQHDWHMQLGRMHLLLDARHLCMASSGRSHSVGVENMCG